jgi:hypothetical protein
MHTPGLTIQPHLVDPTSVVPIPYPPVTPWIPRRRRPAASHQSPLASPSRACSSPPRLLLPYHQSHNIAPSPCLLSKSKSTNQYFSNRTRKERRASVLHPHRASASPLGRCAYLRRHFWDRSCASPRCKGPPAAGVVRLAHAVARGATHAASHTERAANPGPTAATSVGA